MGELLYNIRLGLQESLERESEKWEEERMSPVNPLTSPMPWWYEVYKRVKLLPWWFTYNMGFAGQAALKDKIIKLGIDVGFQDAWLKKIIRHAVSEFSKKGLGADYYGYHNIDHELEAAYFTLLAASRQPDKKFKLEDLYYLFVAALFHDYDPLKDFDKPHEDSVEWFIRNDEKIKFFISAVDIDLELVLVIIHRTAFPFKGKIAEHAMQRIDDLFNNAGIPASDVRKRKHFVDLGWFLSVSERIAGYALGDFERAKDLARRNAHALGWHPSVINRESVNYFSMFKEEKEMVDRVLQGVPDEMIERFNNNADSFRKAWADEVIVKDSLKKKQLQVISVVENCSNLDENVMESILEIYSALPMPLKNDGSKFRKSLADNDSILLTLRLDNANGDIVGFAKGGPLENYTLRRGTIDENTGKRNTIYLEPIGIRTSYWGEAGGHKLRLAFLKEAKERGYDYVTAYAYRNVIAQRIKRGESIRMVQKYDPDKLDYYRYDLKKFVYGDFAPYETTFEEPMSI